MAFSPFRGSTRTFLEAGLALKVIFSPVKGLVPTRTTAEALADDAANGIQHRAGVLPGKAGFLRNVIQDV